MLPGQNSPRAARAGGLNRRLLNGVRQLLVRAQAMGNPSDEDIKAVIDSAAVAEPAQNHSPVSETTELNLTFSLAPHDLSDYVTGKGSYFDRGGAFSDVYKCVLHRSPARTELIAVKALRINLGDEKDTDKTAKKLRGEVHIWVRMSHPNVLPLYGMSRGFGPLPALVSPWIENGPLNKYLEGPGQRLTKVARISLLVKVAKALEYIHSKRVVHGDLTGSNILIGDNGEPLISDFGLSSILREFNKTSYFTTCKPGAMRWAAPELVLSTSPDPNTRTDIYSFGCIMLQVFSGRAPYYDMIDTFVMMCKVKDELPKCPASPPVDQSHWEMIKACLRADDARRPSLQEIIEYLTKERSPRD